MIKRFIVILLFSASTAHGAITISTYTAIASASGGNITSAGLTTTGATLLVASIDSYVGSPDSVMSDSNLNTWVARTNRSSGSQVKSQIFYVVNPTVGAAHTFTASNSNTAFPCLTVIAFNGAKTTSPYDTENGAGTANGNSLATGSVSPSEDNEVLFTDLGLDAVDTASINSSFTQLNHVAYAAGKHFGCDSAYLIQTTAGAVNPTWSWTSFFDASTSIATFKAAAVAGTSVGCTPPFCGIIQ